MARDDGDDSSLQSIATDTLGLEKTVADLEYRRMFSDHIWTTYLGGTQDRIATV